MNYAALVVLTLKPERLADVLCCSQNGEIDYVWAFHTLRFCFDASVCSKHQRHDSEL